MRKYLLVIAIVLVACTGCGKKEEEIKLEDRTNADLIRNLDIELRDLKVTARSEYGENSVDMVLYYKGSDVFVEYTYPTFKYNNILIFNDKLSYNKVSEDENGYKSSLDKVSVESLFLNVVNLKGEYTAKVEDTDKKVIKAHFNSNSEDNDFTYDVTYDFEYGIPTSIELFGGVDPFKYTVTKIELANVDSSIFELNKDNYITEEEFMALIEK